MSCGAPVAPEPSDSPAPAAPATPAKALPVVPVPSTEEVQYTITGMPILAPSDDVGEPAPTEEKRKSADAAPAEAPALVVESPPPPAAANGLTSKIDDTNLTGKTISPYAGRQKRKSRLPVLEILMTVLLLGGAVAAVWMLRSSLPAKRPQPASDVAVTISPATAKVVAGKAVDFAATVSGTDNVEVIWSIQEGDTAGRVVSRGAKAEAGKVASVVVYIAPGSPGTYHLVATSKDDPQKSATAEIKVTKAAGRH